MTNKPRAWINIFLEDNYLDWEKDEKARLSIPLYRHKQNELSDDEIANIANKFVDAYGYPFPAVSFARKIIEEMTK
jgi:hypothetical protein